MKKAFLFLNIFVLIACGFVAADSSFEKALQKIMNRSEFRHSKFGVHVLSLDTKQSVYALNSEQFFIPASTTKLITVGASMKLLGADFRFHTRVYRSSEISEDGTLQGDLILVASGDPNLSGRVQENDSLAFENEDHSYGGEESRGIGDPLLIIHKFAKQVAARNIKRVSGRVLVDGSLFSQGSRELGTGVVISPIIVNDNVIDVLVSPGKSNKSALNVKVSPETAYFKLINHAVTGKKDSNPDLHWESDVENSDGSRTVTLSGTLPEDGKETMFSYGVADPIRFAEFVLTEGLREEGIVANPRLKEDQPDFKSLSKFYKSENQLAEHISPPMSEEVKVILKVSQNLHASSMPYLLSAVVAKKEPPQAGFDLIHEFLTKAGVKDDGASQEDGAGGSANFTPAFMTSYLAYMAKQKEAQIFHDALPILGRDGTLFEIQTKSRAAGNVFAKTGTYGRSDLLHNGVMVDSKALAGYTTTRSGHRVAFAIFVNHVPVSSEPNAIRDIVGQAVGEIAAAIYEHL